MRTLLPVLLLLSTPALAGWPEDIDLEGFTEHDGIPVVDTALLGEAYTDLVAELGTSIANRPVEAETLGFYGWSFDVSGTFVFREAISRGEEAISPWDRAMSDEQATNYQVTPAFTVRKGLPMSTEVGASFGWVGMSNQALVSGFGRIALTEGYKPWPDLSLQLGYSGYVGNDQLDVGVMDFGVTLGSTYALGQKPGIHNSKFSPYANYSLLRVTANPTLDPELEAAIGAVTLKKGEVDPLVLHRVAMGFKMVTGNVHFKLGGTWVPNTIPTATVGTGVTF